MADQGFQEKTEKATPRRRKKARDEGKTARSMELNSALVIVLGFSSIFLIAPHLSRQLMNLMGSTMSNAASLATSDPTFTKVFGDNMIRFFTMVAPFFVVMILIGLISNIAQIGFQISPKAFKPKFEKLDLAKGLQRLFSLRSGVTLVRDTIKLFLVGIVGYKAIAGEFNDFFLLPDMSAVQLGAAMGKMALIVALKIGAAMLVLAILDYAYQRYEFEKSIKMSKHDIKEEYKETDGSPQVKARVRQIQRETAHRRMMDDVPQADVVITNPTHFAVAIKYSPEQDSAPMVIAKGQRLIAQKIKQIAYDNDVPVIEDKPLARALFKMCDVGQTVPAQLYRAVAEVLAYVYRLKGKVLG